MDITEKLKEERKKIIELGLGRNPLLSIPKKGSYLHVIDEIPEQIFNKISISEESMVFQSLPDIDQPLPREKKEDFKKKLEEFKSIDAEYRRDIANLDRKSETYVKEKQLVERRAIDCVRETLNLPPRTWDESDPEKHARDHGINPELVDLPGENQDHEDGRYKDNKIQTCLFKSNLDTLLRKLLNKMNQDKDQNGFNPLYIVYGFLEWKKLGSTDGTKISPLLLQQVKMERETSQKSWIYKISAEESEIEANHTLLAYLEESGVKLKNYEGEGIEGFSRYLEDIDSQRPSDMEVWKTQRRVTVGIFSPKYQIIYEDLNPDNWKNLEDESLFSQLFLDRNRENDLETDPTEDTEECYGHNVDDMPQVVCNADLSQYTVIKKVINGSNLVVQGPPGTGKSQTIVNTIAGSIFKGKKVLFVAEKKVALDVVKNKLDALGLGEFCLSLANKNPKQVYQDLESRIKMGDEGSVINKANYKANYEKLKELKKKIEIRNKFLSANSDFDGLTRYEALGKIISSQKELNNLPTEISQLDMSLININSLNQLQDIREKFSEAGGLPSELSRSSAWFKIENMLDFTDFDIENLKNSFEKYSETANLYVQKIFGVIEKNNFQDLTFDNVDRVINCYSSFLSENIQIPIEASQRDPNSTELIKSIYPNLKDFMEKYKDMKNLSSMEKYVPILEKLISLLDKYKLDSLSDESVETGKRNRTKKIKILEQINEIIQDLIEKKSDIKNLLLSEISKLIEVGGDLDNEELKFCKFILDEKIESNFLEKIINRKKDISGILDKNINSDLLKEENERKIKKFIKFLDRKSVIKNKWLKICYYIWNFKEIRKANLFCSSIFSNTDYKPDNWVEDLKKIHEYVTKFKEFNNNEEFKKKLGEYFNGVNSNFNLIEKCYETVSSLEKTSKNLKSLDIAKHFFSNFYSREFKVLKNGFRDLIENDEIGKNKKLDELIHIIRKKRKDKENMEKCIVEMKKNIESVPGEIFYGNKEDIRKRKEFIKQISAFKDSFRRLDLPINDSATRISELFDVQKIKAEILFFELDESSIPIFNAFRQKDLSDETLRNLEQMRKKYNKSLEDICRLTKSESSFWKKDIYQQVSFNQKTLKDITYLRNIIDSKNIVNGLDKEFRDIFDKFFSSELNNDFGKVFEALFYKALGRAIVSKDQNGLFPLDSIEGVRNSFESLDKKHIKDTIREYRSAILQNSSPDPGNQASKVENYTGMTFIKHQIQLSKKMKPIRQLMKQAKQAVLELTPCIMASPTDVSQYLPRSRDFDLIIIDEASQMLAEHAIGALLRSKKAMIVGDSKQLPPSSFFRAKNQNENDQKSILVTAAKTFAERTLLWHYRSRHSSLIKFSNQIMYNNKLKIFPAHDENSPSKGVSLVEVENPIYKDKHNLEEAKKIVSGIVTEMSDHPDRSIGVVTMNEKQMNLIEELLDVQMIGNQVCLNYISKWNKENEGLEKFFIKNLENVQGDERDTILISTVYGSNEDGQVAERFGPINQHGGQNRLNVLFTRAKERIVTYTSLPLSSIGEDNPGRKMLKQWLQYSREPNLPLGREPSREPDSDFERHVMSVIESFGYQVTPQVGQSGYFIDLGVKLPNEESGFILGVECDGASYHSHPSARERDHLREEILRNQGWDIYRIWSTSWYQSQQEQSKKLKNYIEDRCRKLGLRPVIT